MTPEFILAIVNSLISSAFQLYTSAKQITGEEKIPEWGDLIEENKLLQAAIDAEKEV